MTLARRQALISLVIWGAILVGLVSVLVAVGPERFSAPKYAGYRLVTAAILLPGYLITTWMLWRQRRGRRSGELDERDERVALRASEITLLTVAIILYILCVVLWEVYKYGPGAPAGWFYVLAYLTVVLLSLVHAAARLICDVAGSADG
jgi:uncharacterized membrane protein